MLKLVIKLLIVFLFCFSISFSQGKNITYYTFTIADSNSLVIKDSYITERFPGVNYGISTLMRVGDEVSSSISYVNKALIKITTLDDSIGVDRKVDTAFLYLVISSRGTGFTATNADSLQILALKYNFNELKATWVRYDSTESNVNWDSAGANKSGGDYYKQIATYPVVRSTGDTIKQYDTLTFNIKMAIDSGWMTNGFIIRFNYEDHETSQYIQFGSSENTTSWPRYRPRIYVVYHIVPILGNLCSITSTFGGTNLVLLTKFANNYSFSARLDSLQIWINPRSTNDDTLFGVVYNADSTLKARSDDSIITGTENDFILQTFRFRDTKPIIRSGTMYFWGVYPTHGTEGNNWYCQTGNDTTTGFAALATQQAPVTTLTGLIAMETEPCFRAYLTDIRYGKVIILGSCDEPEDNYLLHYRWDR